MNKIFRITDLLEICIKNIFLIGSGALLGGIILYVISAFVIQPQYVSSAEMYVFNSDNLFSTAGIDAYDLAAAQKMTGTYITIIESDLIVDQIYDRLSEKYSQDALNEMMNLELKKWKKQLTNQAIRDCIEVENVDSTEVIRITVETKSPILSIEICQWLLELSSDQITRIIGKGFVKDVGGVSFPLEPSHPKLAVYTLIGATAGGLIAAAAVLLAGYFDNKIMSKESLEKRVQMNILGEIPQM